MGSAPCLPSEGLLPCQAHKRLLSKILLFPYFSLPATKTDLSSDERKAAVLELMLSSNTLGHHPSSDSSAPDSGSLAPGTCLLDIGNCRSLTEVPEAGLSQDGLCCLPGGRRV